MKRCLSWLALAASAAFFAACGGDDAPPTQEPSGGGRITGQVVQTDTDEPLPNASVSVGDRSVRTGPDGQFVLDGLPASAAASVKVEAAGHGANVARVAVVQGEITDLRVRLVKLAPARAIDAGVATTLTLAGSPAQVMLPAGALVDAETGAPVSGTVSASLTDIDPASDPGRMPGAFTTEQSGEVRSIESFGAVKVDLRDANGRRLDLAPNQTATVRIPLSTRSPNPPATVPLFHFDETTGFWTQEGSATLKTGDGEPYYEGTVSHFSYWNADIVADTVWLDGCVVDDAGKPAGRVQVSGSGVDYSGLTSAITDAEGRFRMPVRRNSTTAVWAATLDRVTTVHDVAVGATNMTMPACMKLGAANAGTPGKLAPRLLLNPRNTTIAVDDYAFFTAVIEGTQPMQYQWRRNGQPIDGAVSSVLFVGPALATDDGAVFSVTATNVAGTVTSTGATLSVSTTPIAPAILLQPRPLTVNAGDTAVFAVSATGSNPLAYQWRRNGIDIAGATQPVLSLTAGDTDNGALYSVVVRNAAGTVTSGAAQLTVVSSTSPPVIVAGPVGRVASVGDSVTFSVAATGSGPLSYRWQRNGVDIAQAIESTYTLDAVAASDHLAAFRVVVSNAHGSTPSEAAVLTVNAGTSDQTERVLRLFGEWSTGLMAVTAPLSVTDEDFIVLPAAEVCSTGSVTATLDGGSLPAPGQPLPFGTHALAARFSTCGTESAVFDGASSVTYTMNDAALRTGSADATVTDFVHQGTDLNGDAQSIRTNGQARIEFDGSLVGTTETTNMRFIPASGFSFAQVDSGLASTAVSGSVSTRFDEVGGMATRMRQDFSAYTFTRGGVTYVFSGFMAFEFNGTTGATGSGTVSITANGVEVARISGTQAGYGVEVLNGGIPASAGPLSSGATTRRTATIAPMTGMPRMRAVAR